MNIAYFISKSRRPSDSKLSIPLVEFECKCNVTCHLIKLFSGIVNFPLIGCAAKWCFWLLISQHKTLDYILNQFDSLNGFITLIFGVLEKKLSFFVKTFMKIVFWLIRVNVIVGLSTSYETTNSGWYRQPFKRGVIMKFVIKLISFQKPYHNPCWYTSPLSIPNSKVHVHLLSILFLKTVLSSWNISAGFCYHIWSATSCWFSSFGLDFLANQEFYFITTFAAVVVELLRKEFSTLSRFKVLSQLNPYVALSWSSKPKISKFAIVLKNFPSSPTSLLFGSSCLLFFKITVMTLK